ncbi:uncharacterized protein PRCAT00000476001 [Priceomyces carsonii]|uniref:uncharacterized protein n=1 Tax=Priceomyces carsonii TaxID=28549 RepID=UPI002ED7AEA0|nr:unnamed protein product [Priceomyces carsonii]
MTSLQTLFPGLPPSFEPHITITTNLWVDLEDADKRRDDVNKILSASAVALNSIPKDGTNLVTLGKVDSQRKFLKKLYFKAYRDPKLISFARIIRELFVILPNDIEQENMKQNPQLYTLDEEGNSVRRRPLKKRRSQETGQPPKEFDQTQIKQDATVKAAEWAVTEYDPHLSLVYSDLYPIDNALWRTIKTRIQDYLNIDNCDADYLEDNGLEWNGGVLKLVLCEGDVNEWVTLGSVDLH